MISKKKLYGAIALIAFSVLAGCASAPGPVVADVPLVHPNYALQSQGQVVNIAPLKKIEPGQTISIADISWQVGQAYFSASRQQCFALRKSQSQKIGDEARLCQSQSQWMYFPSMLGNSLSARPES